ncbi:MAG: hypothetical protein HOY75_34905 [Streptomyces sp.]|nr:hypothetical protein [Streptomyces sp.]
MSFDSEWSQLKADAAEQQSAHDRGLVATPGRLGRQRFRDIQDGEVAETGE